MNIFKEIHRELFKNLNLLNNGRFVFVEPTESGPTNVEINTKAPEVTKKTTENPKKMAADTGAAGDALSANGSTQFGKINPKEVGGTKPETVVASEIKAAKDEKATDEIVKIKNGREAAREQFSKIFNKIVSEDPSSEYILKDERTQKAITIIINELPESDIKLIQKGEDSKLTKEHTVIIKNAFHTAYGIEELDDKSDEEINNLKKLKLGDKSFDQIFGANSPVAELISRQYEIKLDGEKMTIGTTEINDINDLKSLLPEGYAEAMGSPEDQRNELLKNLDQGTKNQIIAGTILNDTLNNYLESQGKTGAEKASGFAETISAFLQLFAAISQAIKTGDWDTLNDFLTDWNETGQDAKEVAKRHKIATKNYKDILNKNEDTLKLNDLVTAYNNPRDTVANNIFKAQDGMTEAQVTKYRGEIKPLIVKHLSKQLGIKVDEITEDGMIKATKPSTGEKLEITVGEGTDESKFEATINIVSKEDDVEKRTALHGVGGKKDFKSLADLKVFINDGSRLPDTESPPSKVASNKTEKKKLPKVPKHEANIKSPEKTEEKLFSSEDKPTAEQVLASVRAAGKFNEFNNAYRVANPKNAAKWQLKWMIDNNIPKASETEATFTLDPMIITLKK